MTGTSRRNQQAKDTIRAGDVRVMGCRLKLPTYAPICAGNQIPDMGRSRKIPTIRKVSPPKLVIANER